MTRGKYLEITFKNSATYVKRKRKIARQRTLLCYEIVFIIEPIISYYEDTGTLTRHILENKQKAENKRRKKHDECNKKEWFIFRKITSIAVESCVTDVWNWQAAINTSFCKRGKKEKSLSQTAISRISSAWIKILSSEKFSVFFLLLFYTENESTWNLIILHTFHFNSASLRTAER